MVKLKALGMQILLLISLPLGAAEPDFYITFPSCKMTVGYLVLSDESLKTFDGDATAMGCIRQGKKISCSFVFEDGGKGIRDSETYEVVIDSPPLLYFRTKNGSDFIAIDTSQHAAVLIVRIAEKEFAGSKVCQGAYMTSFEVDNLQE